MIACVCIAMLFGLVLLVPVLVIGFVLVFSVFVRCYCSLFCDVLVAC